LNLFFFLVITQFHIQGSLQHSNWSYFWQSCISPKLCLRTLILNLRKIAQFQAKLNLIRKIEFSTLYLRVI
jgi:hypothetical protein